MKIFDYHIWANEKPFQHLNELPAEVLTTEIQSVFPTIKAVITHMIIVDKGWLIAMKGEDFENVKESREDVIKQMAGMNLEELQVLYADVTEEYRAFIDQIDDLAADFALHHPRFPTLPTTRSELVQHVVNHGTYHRGNITAMLRQLGYKGPSTDYIYYLYEKK